jgi:hypothetical protein
MLSGCGDMQITRLGILTTGSEGNLSWQYYQDKEEHEGSNSCWLSEQNR